MKLKNKTGKQNRLTDQSVRSIERQSSKKKIKLSKRSPSKKKSISILKNIKRSLSRKSLISIKTPKKGKGRKKKVKSRRSSITSLGICGSYHSGKSRRSRAERMSSRKSSECRKFKFEKVEPNIFTHDYGIWP